MCRDIVGAWLAGRRTGEEWGLVCNSASAIPVVTKDLTVKEFAGKSQFEFGLDIILRQQAL